MAKRAQHSNELIHCENCGEDYAATYRCCPFCEERPTRGRGGSRLKSNTRGGGYGGSPSPLRILGWVLSLALIIAAAVIVFNLLGGLLNPGGDDEDVQPSPSPDVQTSAEPTPSPDPTPSPTPVLPSVTALSLNHSDVTLRANETLTLSASVTPSDWGGTVTWTSSDASAATVSDTGLVTNVNTGSSKVKVTITAAAGDKTAVCTIYCNGGSNGAPSAGTPGTGTSGAAVTLDKTDFTIRPQDPNSVTIRASGGDGTYSWSSSNTGVATVSSSGVVTKVGAGMCTITCTSGGSSATCIVRVS